MSLIARHYSWPLNVALCKTDDVDGCGVDEETTPGPLECSNKPSPSHSLFQKQKQNQNPSHQLCLTCSTQHEFGHTEVGALRRLTG